MPATTRGLAAGHRSGGPQARIWDDPPAPGTVNMARDLGMLAAVEGGEADVLVRTYAFAPACLSLGRLQPDTAVDWEACRRDGVDVVRRPTGGRSILHDAELTYAVAARVTDPVVGGDVLASCSRIHAIIAAALARHGISTTPRERAGNERSEARERAVIQDCFARPASHELLDAEGHKLVGSAQVRRGPALLQHGSILLAPPRAAAYFRGAGEAGMTGGIRGLGHDDVSREQLAATVAAAFRSALGTG